VIGLSAAVFVAGCVIPLAYLFVASGADVLAQLGRLLIDERQRRLLATTGLLGLGTAVGSTLMGVPLGVVLARIGLPLKPLQRIALVAPVLLPPYIVGLGWMYLGGGWTSGLLAVVVVLSLAYFPISMLATEAAMRRIDGRLEEAALLVGPPWFVLRTVSLPIIAPHVASAALVIFVLAVSDFSVAGLLQVQVYTTEVFTAFSAMYDFPRALVLSVPLVALSVIAAVAAGVLAGPRLVSTRRATAVPHIRLDRWRPAALSLVTVVLIVALVVPVTVLVLEASLARDPAAVMSGSGIAVANSLLLAAAGATLVVAVSMWLGHGASRAKARLALPMLVMCLALFAVPSTVVGVSLIALWNQPGLPGAVYSTDAMLLLGYLARFAPIAVLITAAAARQVPVSHEEAAAMSGASWLRTMARVVLPQMRFGLAATWILVFILAFGELGVSILVAPPGETTLPIRIYTMIANAPGSHVALLALLQALVLFVPLVLLALGSFRLERS
jgi:iron(III) transport system permease protein